MAATQIHRDFLVFLDTEKRIDVLAYTPPDKKQNFVYTYSYALDNGNVKVYAPCADSLATVFNYPFTDVWVTRKMLFASGAGNITWTYDLARMDSKPKLLRE